MPALPVVLDASVVVPYNLTDFWLRADMLGLLRVHWSEEILAETERNIARGKTPEKAARRVSAMRAAFPAACCDPPPTALIATMTNHPKDRHVLALAICAPDVQTIVTDNLKHFPLSSCAPYGVRALTADALMQELLAHDPAGVWAVLEAMAAPRTREPRTPRAIIEVLRTKCGIKTAGALLSALATQAGG